MNIVSRETQLRLSKLRVTGPAVLRASTQAIELPVLRKLRERLQAGGPGSGCHGPNCGRPGGNIAKIPKSQYPLSKAQTKVESTFRRQIGSDPEKWKQEYRAKFGNVLNADNAKELSEDYKKNRTDMAMAVHEPASWLVKQMFAEDLVKPPDPEKSNAVLFTAGGAGAGKTTAIENDPETKAVFDQAHSVLDGTMRPATKAIDYVGRTLGAGKDAVVVYVHRDPVEAFSNGVLPRAARTGRTVPLEEYARQHSSIQESMANLQDTFKNNPRFAMVVLDNSGGKGKATNTTLAQLPAARSYEELMPVLKSELAKAYNEGKISKQVYNATLGHHSTKEIGV